MSQFKPLSNSEKRAVEALKMGKSMSDAYITGFTLARHWAKETVAIRAERFFTSERVEYFVDLETPLQSSGKTGTVSMYKPEYVGQMLKYFSVSPVEVVEHEDKKTGQITITRTVSDFPTKSGFAAKIGVHRDTIFQWAIKTNDKGELVYPDFADMYKRAADYQEHCLVTNTLHNRYNSSFASFLAKNLLGWKDNKGLELTGNEEKPLVPITKEMTPELAAQIYRDSLSPKKSD